MSEIADTHSGALQRPAAPDPSSQPPAADQFSGGLLRSIDQFFPLPRTYETGGLEDKGSRGARVGFLSALREALSIGNARASRLSILLYSAGLIILLARFASGSSPSIPGWVNWTALGAASLTTLLLVLSQRRQRPDWVYAASSLFGAAVLSFLLLYYGPGGAYMSLYLLTLLVPALFFSLRLVVGSALIVAVGSTVPFLFGPVFDLRALSDHLLVDVPVYFVLPICANLVLAGMREKLVEVSRQRRVARDFAVLQQLTAYIASTHDINEICQTVVDKLFQTFRYRYVSIYLLEGDELVPMTQCGYPGQLGPLPLGNGVMSRVIATGQAALVPDARQVTDFLYLIEDIACEASAPILRRSQGSYAEATPMETPSALGSINLEDTTADALGEADLNLIRTIAGALSVAFESANLLRERRERNERLELANRLAQAVAANTDLSSVLSAARGTLQALTPVDSITVALLAEDGKHMKVTALDGVDFGVNSRAGTLIPLEDYPPELAAKGRCLALAEIPGEGPCAYANQLYRAGLRSFIAMPMLSGDKVIGVFTLASRKPHACSDTHLPVLQVALPHLSTAVQNAILYGEIRQRAETDTLTNLFNLTTFYSRLNRLISEAAHTGETFTVVMLDLDLFKTYNDSFGHLAGDGVLRQVGALIKQSMRPDDIAARCGGDEFSMILRGLPADRALDRVAALCEKIGRTPFQPEVSGDSEDAVLRTRGVAMLSCSAGLASYPADSTEAEHLAHLADTALYEAKRAGRNRVCAYNAFGPALTVETNIEDSASRKRYQSLIDTDPHLDATSARESRAALNDYLQAVYALVSAIELRDGYSHGHSERVAFYAVRLGEALGLSSQELSALRVAGLLHDIGKIALPYNITHKPGKLTPEEWELVRQHPLYGEGILRPLRNFSAVWSIVSAHHENYDGSGYPRQLAGADIPVGGRIMRIADSYEVMTVAGRTYRNQAKSPVEAVAELKLCAGTMFDPSLVQLFIDQVVGDPRALPPYNPETNPLTSSLLDSDSQLALAMATDKLSTESLASGALRESSAE